jgi:hypothetical protein
MPKFLAALALLLLLPSRASSAEPEAWLAVGNAELLAALKPLADHRRAEGYRVVLSSQPVAKAIAEAGGKPAFLILVGDDAPDAEKEPWQLAAPRRKLYRWRNEQQAEFAADALVGDLDGDLAPDVPVGRIPARSPKQVGQAVEKILAHERRAASLADLRLPVWTGSPEYGPAFDALATGLLVSSVDTGAPGWTEPWIVAGDPRHPLCGWPAEQAPAFAAQAKAGGLLTVLMGHSNETHFYSMAHGRERIFFSAADARKPWGEGAPTPPLVMFTCSAGTFTGREDCLAEAMFALPGGPVAAIAATTESHPLTNYFSGVSLLAGLGGSERRLGKVWLAAQLHARKSRNLFMESLLKDVEGKLDEAIDQEQLRRDQLLMYALLGDPATRMPLPVPLAAKATKTPTGWRWHVDRPAGAERLEVAHRPALPAFAPVEKPPENAAVARTAAASANGAFAFVSLASPDGAWEGTADKPGTLRFSTVVKGRLHVTALKLAP